MNKVFLLGISHIWRVPERWRGSYSRSVIKIVRNLHCSLFLSGSGSSSEISHFKDKDRDGLAPLIFSLIGGGTGHQARDFILIGCILHQRNAGQCQTIKIQLTFLLIRIVFRQRKRQRIPNSQTRLKMIPGKLFIPRIAWHKL